MILVKFVNDETGEGLGEFHLQSYMPFGRYMRYRLGGLDYEPIQQIITPLDDEEFEAEQLLRVSEIVE